MKIWQRVAGALRWRYARARNSFSRRELLFFGKDPLTPPSLAQPGVEEIALPRSMLLRFPEPGWLSAAEIRHWLGRPGKHLLGLMQGDRVTGYCWVEQQVADLDFLEMMLVLPPDLVYVSKVLVTPEQRGNGVGTALLRAGVVKGLQLGATRALIACVPENDRMRSILAREGWEPFAHLALEPPGFLRRYRFSFAGSPARSRVVHGRAPAARALLSAAASSAGAGAAGRRVH